MNTRLDRIHNTLNESEKAVYSHLVEMAESSEFVTPEQLTGVYALTTIKVKRVLLSLMLKNLITFAPSARNKGYCPTRH